MKHILEDLKHATIAFLWFIVLVIIASLFTSCRSTHTLDKEVVHDTCIIELMQKDSIHIHDSIFSDRYQKGDTVFLYKYVEKTAWRDKLKIDSIYVAKTDTIVRTETIEVNRLNFFQKSLMAVGIISLLGTLCAELIRLYEWRK